MTDYKWTEKLEREYQEDCIRVGFLRINDSHRQIYLLARLRSEEEVKEERGVILALNDVLRVVVCDPNYTGLSLHTMLRVTEMLERVERGIPGATNDKEYEHPRGCGCHDCGGMG